MMCKTPSRQMGTFLVIALMLLSSTASAQDPSLVLYFSFDNDVAAEATDHSLYGNNGAIEGDPVVVAGQFGDAFTFDASDDQVVVPSNETLDIQDHNLIVARIERQRIAEPAGHHRRIALDRAVIAMHRMVRRLARHVAIEREIQD